LETKFISGTHRANSNTAGLGRHCKQVCGLKIIIIFLYVPLFLGEKITIFGENFSEGGRNTDGMKSLKAALSKE